MDPWLRRWKPSSLARVRLVALPPAGGGARLYQPLAALLPGGVGLIT
ncbi:hypothetical protein ACFQS1_25200 [Paractinoplanes rhizophilus]|jgi:surfactin synthase thioesterase subunit|uniref:Uncharacterized protein n=1 Tax=Paractinoplanes rhizophilus TaxID=1416877 RepID=A0ABW2HYM8_9ACTN|nr:hypothetical protein [Actinoplanes sp.]